MNYYNKFIKYQLKYSLFSGGSKLDNLKDIFNLFFGNYWILTGSEAIKMYLNHFKITEFDFPTNDVDIFYISKDSLTSRNIGKFTRKQDQVESSMTFENKETNESFDVTITKNSRYYYDINETKLDTPENMLENYEENLGLRNNPTDIIKINALKKIVELINHENKQKLELDNDNKRKREHLDEADGNRLRFTHIDVKEGESESPKVGKMRLSDLF
jgi:hypothetical protein